VEESLELESSDIDAAYYSTSPTVTELLERLLDNHAGAGGTGEPSWPETQHEIHQPILHILVWIVGGALVASRRSAHQSRNAQTLPEGHSRHTVCHD
jgi:hypothetical protein